MLALELGDALFGLAHPRDAIEIYQRGAETLWVSDSRSKRMSCTSRRSTSRHAQYWAIRNSVLSLA